MSIDRDSFFLVISMYIHLSVPIATFSHRIKDYRRGKTRGLYPGAQELGEGSGPGLLGLGAPTSGSQKSREPGSQGPQAKLCLQGHSLTCLDL